MKNSQLSSRDIGILLTAAGRAPSGGNTQPWLVEIINDQFTFKLNPQHLDTFIKVNHLDAIFSLGSFAANFDIAASNLGYAFNSTIYIPPQNNRLFSVKYTLSDKRSEPKPHPLYQAVLQRETNRQLSNGHPVSRQELQLLKDTLSHHGKHYQFNTISSIQAKKDAAKILGKVDVYRTKVIKHHQRMMAEIRWTDKEAQTTKDGIDIKTMELPGNVVKMLKLLRDHPKLVKTIPDIALEKNTHPLIENCSHLCCLHSTQPPTSKLLFDAGKVAQMLWLEATNQLLAFHPWSVLTFFILSIKFLPHEEFSHKQELQLLEREQEFKQLMSIPEKNTLLLIFRLSHADSPSARSLRYDWTQFTNIQSPK